MHQEQRSEEIKFSFVIILGNFGKAQTKYLFVPLTFKISGYVLNTLIGS